LAGSSHASSRPGQIRPASSCILRPSRRRPSGSSQVAFPSLTRRTALHPVLPKHRRSTFLSRRPDASRARLTPFPRPCRTPPRPLAQLLKHHPSHAVYPSSHSALLLIFLPSPVDPDVLQQLFLSLEACRRGTPRAKHPSSHLPSGLRFCSGRARPGRSRRASPALHGAASRSHISRVAPEPSIAAAVGRSGASPSGCSQQPGRAASGSSRPRRSGGRPSVEGDA
jgi:hypothetical protein